MVAHRLSVMANCDKVLLISDGVVVEFEKKGLGAFLGHGV